MSPLLPFEDVQQGVLYKRRDVFKNLWRPRWFVLQAEQGIMTYYLLNPATESRASVQAWRVLESSPSPLDTATSAPRRRTTSVDSNVSENSVDYDVVARGTIYLMGCTVQVDEGLSRPSEDLYAFTVTPPTQTEPPYYLAAKTQESRTEWIQKIAIVCRQTRNGHVELNNSINGGMRSISEVEISARPSEVNGQITRESPSDTDGNFGASKWKSMDAERKVFASVPGTIADRIQSVLRSCLPLCEDTALGWTLLFQNRDGVTAYQRTDAQQRTMIKSEAVLDYHPKQVLNLLVDIKRRQTFEKNIQHHERLKELNNHNFLDYYAYHPVWPTTGRDFAVVAHWQVLQNSGTNERAILVLGCSCPEADDLKPPGVSHVRATLFVTMSLLKLVEDNKCHITRLLSYDLEGSVPRQLTSTIMQRQALVPSLLANHLSQTERSPLDRLTSKGADLTNEGILFDVLNHLRDLHGTDDVRRQLDFSERTEPPRATDSGPLDSVAKAVTDSGPLDSVVLPATESSPLDSVALPAGPSETFALDGKGHHRTIDSFGDFFIAGIILLTPVTIFRLAQWCEFPNSDLLFLGCTYLSIRVFVLRRLGTQVSKGSYPTSSFVCRLSIDLKGVLRFIVDQREQDKSKSMELSFVHILVAALSRACAEERILTCRRWHIPWLAIDGFFRNYDDTVDVSLLDVGCPIITIRDATMHTIQEIACYCFKEKKRAEGTCHANNQSEGALPGSRRSILSFVESLLDVLSVDSSTFQEFGQCLIVSATDSDECAIDLDMNHPPVGVNVAAVIGGIKLVRDPASSSASLEDSSASPVTPPKPVLSLSLTFHAPVYQVDSCIRFAECVQTLVETPELI